MSDVLIWRRPWGTEFHLRIGPIGMTLQFFGAGGRKPDWRPRGGVFRLIGEPWRGGISVGAFGVMAQVSWGLGLGNGPYKRKREPYGKEDLEAMGHMGLAPHDWECREAVKAALKQWAKFHDNYCLHLPGRIFYTLKAVICVSLRRRKSYWAEDCVDCIAMFNGQHIGSCAGAFPSWAEDWDELSVGHGIFQDWYYDVYRNANF